MKRVRRFSQNIIPLSFSSSELTTLEEEWAPSPPSLMKKSISEPSLPLNSEISIDFEGDGPLGIVWGNKDNDAFVVKIVEGTVASEEIDLEIGYKLLQIGDYNCSHISYSDIMNLIRLKWQKFSKINLTFSIKLDDLFSSDEESDSSEELEEDIVPLKEIEKCPIYSFLMKHNATEFYQKFKELGANSLDDLNYIEYQDLINMKMNTEKRKSISEDLNLHKINVYFNPNLSKVDLEKEKEKFQDKNCNFIEIRPHLTN